MDLIVVHDGNLSVLLEYLGYSYDRCSHTLANDIFNLHTIVILIILIFMISLLFIVISTLQCITLCICTCNCNTHRLCVLCRFSTIVLVAILLHIDITWSYTSCWILWICTHLYICRHLHILYILICLDFNRKRLVALWLKLRMCQRF